MVTMRTRLALTLLLVFCGSYTAAQELPVTTDTTSADGATNPSVLPESTVAGTTAPVATPGSTAPGTTCRTYLSIDTDPAAAAAVTDAMTLPPTLPVPTEVSVSDVRVKHPNTNALKITLAHVPLAALNATAGADPAAANTTATDDATANSTAAASQVVLADIKQVRTAMPNGTLAPTAALPAFVGPDAAAAAGVWVLRVADLGATAAERTIDLLSWTLQLCFDSAALAASEPESQPNVTASQGPSGGASPTTTGILPRSSLRGGAAGAAGAAGDEPLLDGPIATALRNRTADRPGLLGGNRLGSLRNNTLLDGAGGSGGGLLASTGNATADEGFVSALLTRLADGLESNGTGASGWRLNNITLPPGPVQTLLSALIDIVNTTESAAEGDLFRSATTPPDNSLLATMGTNRSLTAQMAQSAADYLSAATGSSGLGSNLPNLGAVLEESPYFRGGVLSAFTDEARAAANQAMQPLRQLTEPLRVRAQSGALTSLSLSQIAAQLMQGQANSLLSSTSARSGTFREAAREAMLNSVQAAQQATDLITSSVQKRAAAMQAQVAQIESTARSALKSLSSFKPGSGGVVKAMAGGAGVGSGAGSAAVASATANLQELLNTGTPGLRNSLNLLNGDAGSGAQALVNAYRTSMQNVNNAISSSINRNIGWYKSGASLSLDAVSNAVGRVNAALSASQKGSGPLASMGSGRLSKGLSAYQAALNQLKTSINSIPTIDVNKIYDTYGLRDRLSKGGLSDLVLGGSAGRNGGGLKNIMSGINTFNGLMPAAAGKMAASGR